MTHPLGMLMSTNLIVPFHEIPSVEWFTGALDALARFYRFVSLADVVASLRGERGGNNVCHLTFDDGHLTFYSHALPVLRSRSLPATLFVSPKVIRERASYWFQDLAWQRAHVGDPAVRSVIAGVVNCAVEDLERFDLFSICATLDIESIRTSLAAVAARHRIDPMPAPNVTLEQLREAADSGLVTIGAHTLDHPVLANETDARAEREIRDSVSELAGLLNRPVTAFAYPNGTRGLDFGPREQRYLRAAGVEVAVSTDHGFFSRGTDPLALPRGGCPDLHGEPPMWTLTRLAFLPWWDRTRAALHPRRLSQRQERQAIHALRRSASPSRRSA